MADHEGSSLNLTKEVEKASSGISKAYIKQVRAIFQVGNYSTGLHRL